LGLTPSYSRSNNPVLSWFELRGIAGDHLFIFTLSPTELCGPEGKTARRGSGNAASTGPGKAPGKSAAYLSCLEKLFVPCIRRHAGQFAPWQLWASWTAATFSEKNTVRAKQRTKHIHGARLDDPGRPGASFSFMAARGAAGLFMDTPVFFGKAFFTGPVKNGFKHVNLKFVPVKEMPPYFIEQIAVRVDKAAAGVAFQMKMFPALFFVVYILIRGAFAAAQGIFADLSPGGKPFKVPVNGGLPDNFFSILKMTDHLADCNVLAPKGFHIIKDALSLAGAIQFRTLAGHAYTVS
jgi:hypothetical protein